MSVTDRKPVEHLSHWYHAFAGLGITPKDFYTELQQRIDRFGFPNVAIGHVDFRESGILSAKRRYLRIIRGDLAFDICGAPFGSRVFFVSCWLGRIGLSGGGALALGCLAMIPGIGLLAERGLRPLTCYEIDSALIFQEAIHDIVLVYLDELCGTSGIAPLSQEERSVSMKRLTET